MTVLSRDEIDSIVEIIDFINVHSAVSVKDIKRRFGLTSEEYEMIMDLTMPFIRSSSGSRFWQIAYMTIRAKLERLYEKYKNSPSCVTIIKEVEDILATTTKRYLEETKESA